MSQNINLFAPAFRRQTQAMTLNALAVCLAVVLLALFSVHAYFQHQVTALAEESGSAEALLRAQRGYADKLQVEAAARKKNAPLEAETARLEVELKQARDAMEALKGGVIGTQEGFAEYLRAFSRQSVNGLWLTGLNLGGGGEIEIRGRALSPDLMPGYIQRLNREKVLAGRSFDRLEIGQPRTDTQKGSDKEKDKDKEKDGKPVARTARYLEFSLATAESSKAEKTP